jgi:phage recombination protein Bet
LYDNTRRPVTAGTGGIYMAETAVALRETGNDIAVVITDSQVDLIRRTIAKDATAEELQLFFYDCRRRAVHPLDKLIHFTKRKGKYTPITSIDFMRSRAADTGDYAGNDDAVFVGTPKQPDFAATVTVYRFVRDMRCPFGATARWSEYCPPSDNNQDHMWQKMPHVMLAKCAEALALRKAFPQQLSGLYTAEEMDQARDAERAAQPPIRQPERASAQPQTNGHRDQAQAAGDLVEALVIQVTSKSGKTGDRVWTRYGIELGLDDGTTRWVNTFDKAFAELAESAKTNGDAVSVECKPGQKGGWDVVTLGTLTEPGANG